jgi:hypothetical protein
MAANRSYVLCSLLLCLLSGCNTKPQHPTGVYLSMCSTEDGTPRSRVQIFHVGEDSITVRGLNDFFRGSPTHSVTLPTTVFEEPIVFEYDDIFADTLTATIKAEELTLRSMGMSNDVQVADRLEHKADYEVYLANNQMVANKIFERWSDRSRWSFSADNRIVVRDYRNKNIYDFDHIQLYSIDSFADYRILNIHPSYWQNYFIRAVTASYIALEEVGCVSKYDTLRFVKDTFIESILPPAAALAERAEYTPKTYSTYWYETLWIFTFLNDGTFKYLPDGHFSAGHLYTGRYKEEDGIIDLEYAVSDFADFRAASDPVRLFRLDANNLRWPNGALITREGAEEGIQEDLFHEFVNVCSQMVAKNKFGVSDRPYPYISAEIIAINPEVLVKFSPRSRRNSDSDTPLADTLSLVKIREMYPYKAPTY